ncbi:MAG: hypothetical protein KBT11_08905 [Treponema sp.]|nr:hypothetical protein [Candidatus Treponema equifaecale]
MNNQLTFVQKNQYTKGYMIRKIALLLVCIFSCTFVHSRGTILYDHSKIERLSTFRIFGVVDLRSVKDISAPVVYRTLNHEGGMQITVMEVLNKDEYEGNEGMWLYVLLVSPMWTDDGTWIEENTKFLIFLPDDMAVFDFEK